MSVRRRILRHRFTFEIRSLLEFFCFDGPFVNNYVDDFWVTDGTRCKRFLGNGSDVWSVFLDSFLNIILLKMHLKIMHIVFQLVKFAWCHDVRK